jgi:hypothetical protein
MSTDLATFVGAGARDVVLLADVTRLYIVQLENALFQGDEPFYVAELADRIWVMPDGAAGLQPFLAALIPGLAVKNQVFEVAAQTCPFSWHERIAGVLPLFPVPRLARHSLTSLPHRKPQTLPFEHIQRVTTIE